jgi:DNA-directed RNA polymerase subunit M/transcription elongation factor TFIIS
MTTATEIAPTTKTLPALQLPCPKCGEPTASIALNLWTLDDEDAGNFTCQECENEISLAELRGFISRWSKLIAWLENVPSV